MSRRRGRPVLGWAVRWGLRALIVLCFLTIVQVLSLKFVDPPFTVSTAWRRIQGKDHGGALYSHRLWRSLKEISPHLRKAVLAGEDQRFLSHHGFDFSELNHAIRDLVMKRGHRGASTITMQAARTVFLWSARSWLRKLAEAYYTLLIQICWSKERTLEIYLNTVDWGPGLRGIEAASRRYWNTSSAHLSRYQAALLVAILPNPYRWSPTSPNDRVLRRQKRILRDMDKMPLLS